ncbi:hypothetical protein NSS89_14450 [Caldifermentibacillus hisashii]|uniref:hypothetical protein n=1 Tax=Bacillaceae TaxID=186817 RepID=UPI000AC1CA2E|nr:hypothetical protein [Caldibacillus thermoamylovorans]
MATRIGFVAKKWGFPAQNGDENESRRQNSAFSNSKWRRERVSSSKLRFSQLKMVTRFSFVVKNTTSSPKNGDEIHSYRQKIPHLDKKRPIFRNPKVFI